MGKFKSQVDELQIAMWQQQKICVFVFGDYEFLCHVYGITGANGRHCCLFCTTTKQNMQLSLAERGMSSLRTLESLQNDLEQFKSLGSDIKLAKQCNNVIDDRMLNVPIDQVALPALHISLGTYLKFFNMLEDFCHTTDVKIAAALAKNNTLLRQESFDKYIQSHQEISRLEYVVADIRSKIELVHDATNTAILNNPENETEIRRIYDPRLVYLNDKLNERVN